MSLSTNLEPDHVVVHEPRTRSCYCSKCTSKFLVHWIFCFHVVGNWKTILTSQKSLNSDLKRRSYWRNKLWTKRALLHTWQWWLCRIADVLLLIGMTFWRGVRTALTWQLTRQNNQHPETLTWQNLMMCRSWLDCVLMWHCWYGLFRFRVIRVFWHVTDDVDFCWRGEFIQLVGSYRSGSFWTVLNWFDLNRTGLTLNLFVNRELDPWQDRSYGQDLLYLTDMIRWIWSCTGSWTYRVVQDKCFCNDFCNIYICYCAAKLLLLPSQRFL